MIRSVLIVLATLAGLTVGALAGAYGALLAANLYNWATNGSPEEAGLLLILASVGLPIGSLLGAAIGATTARRLLLSDREQLG